MKNTKLKVENLYKIFGDNPKYAMKLINENIDKDKIFTQTGMTVGGKRCFLLYKRGGNICNNGAFWFW